MRKFISHRNVGAQHAAPSELRNAEEGAACCAPTKIVLTLLLLLCATLAQAAAPAGQWWDLNYGFRRPITIPTGASALATDYALRITFNHAAEVTAGRSLNSGNDIRIVRWTGAAWVELDRILDPDSSWNNASTTIWFRTQTALGANVTDDNYYMYMGNAAAGTPPQDGEAVFSLYDDFESGFDSGRWTRSNNPNVTVSGGVLTVNGTRQIRSNSTFPSDTIWETLSRVSTASPSGVQYYLSANSTNAYTFGANYLRMVASNASTDTAQLSSGGSVNFTPTDPTSLQLYSFTREGSAARFFHNGVQVASFASGASTADMRVLLRNEASAGQTQIYEWIRVRPYRNSEPVPTLGALDDTLIAWWRMDEINWNGVAGEVADAAGNGFNMRAYPNSPNNAVTANTTPALSGNPGTCRYGNFNGSNQYLEMPDNAAFDRTSQVTVTAWIYPRAYGTELKSIVSKDDNYEFHLNAAGQINWWWNGGGTREITTTGTPVPLNQWTHVAITYRANEQRVYINGVVRGTNNRNEALPTNNWALQIGYDGSSSSQPLRYWNGYIDEVRIYGKALTATEVTAAMNDRHPCVVENADHLAIEHDGFGIHCLAENITVYPRDASNNNYPTYSETITLNTGTGGGDWSLVSGAGSFSNGDADDGIATYSWSSGQLSATFALTYRSGPASINITASSATISDDNTEGNLVWGASGFTVTSTPLTNPTLPITTFAAAQTAGTAFNMYITAYGTTPTDTQCGVIESYAGNRSVKFWSTYNNPNTGTRIVQVNGNNIALTEGASAAQTVNFSNGQATVSALYRDAGSIRIGMKDDTVSEPSGGGIRGATSNFVVRPARFAITNIQRTSGGFANPGAANANGAVFIAAGAAFSATVTAQDVDSNTTPNYGRETPAESVQLQANLVAPVGGANPGIGGSFGGFTNGVASGTAFSWAEVGIITLTPSVLDGNYLGAGNVTGTTTGNVGRFIPNDFNVTATGPGSFASSCTPASYVYMGQPMTYSTAPTISLTARAVGGGTTQNYQGAFFKLQSGAPTTFSYSTNTGTLNTGSLLTTGNPVAASLGNGLASLAFNTATGLSFQHTAPPIAPFTPTLSMSVDVRDTDNVTTAINPHAIANISSPQQRWGRVAFRNAVGSELLNLPLGLRAEYFLNDNAGFIQNEEDICTTGVSIDPLSLVFGGSLNSGETCILDTGDPGLSGLGCAAAGPAGSQFRAPPLAGQGGNFNAILRAPGQGNGGTVTLTAVAPDWLLFDWNAATPGLERPSGIATFGIFQGNSKRIYQGEK